MPPTIKLILCDDQAIVTEGLQVILGTVPDFEVVAVAHDGAEAVDLVEEHGPDLVLMDLRMPIMNGIQATGRIRERFPETRVLVLTTYDDDGWVFDAIRAGADGYLLKDTPREESDRSDSWYGRGWILRGSQCGGQAAQTVGSAGGRPADRQHHRRRPQ